MNRNGMQPTKKRQDNAIGEQLDIGVIHLDTISKRDADKGDSFKKGCMAAHQELMSRYDALIPVVIEMIKKGDTEGALASIDDHLGPSLHDEIKIERPNGPTGSRLIG